MPLINGCSSLSSSNLPRTLTDECFGLALNWQASDLVRCLRRTKARLKDGCQGRGKPSKFTHRHC